MEVEVVFASAGREAPLTPGELDFRDLVSNGRRRAEFGAWCDRVRFAWERENVVWLHGYRNGKPVWRRERPPPEEPEPEPSAPKGAERSEVRRFKIEASLTLNPRGGSTT